MNFGPNKIFEVLGMGDKKVIVYTTNTCPYCVLAKDYLKKKGVEFQEINVSNDREKAMEMMKKSGHNGVPQIEINGQMVLGFNKPKIDQLLGL